MRMLDNINCVPYGYNPSTVVPEEQPEPAAEEEEEELDPVAGALFEDVVHAMNQKIKRIGHTYRSIQAFILMAYLQKPYHLIVFLGGLCVLC